MNPFNLSQSVGEIVAISPKASEIFKKYNIDFCCGGNKLLSEAIKEENLDENEILAKLNKILQFTKKNTDEADFREMSSSNLIDHIVDEHHVYLKKALPELSEFTSKIMRVHGTNHEELFKVHKLFHSLKTDLEQHLIKEEEILFPMIKDYEKNPSKETLGKIQTSVKETEDEHEAAGNILKELRQITNQYSMPEDGCGTYNLTYKRLEELEGDLFQHIHLENNILFKRLGIDIGE